MTDNRNAHDDVIKWKHFPRCWPFVRGIPRWPVNSPHKGQWRGALIFSLISAWINGWVNNPEAGDLRRHHAHYDVIVMDTEIMGSAFWGTSCIYMSLNWVNIVEGNGNWSAPQNCNVILNSPSQKKPIENDDHISLSQRVNRKCFQHLLNVVAEVLPDVLSMYLKPGKNISVSILMAKCVCAKHWWLNTMLGSLHMTFLNGFFVNDKFCILNPIACT